ncbi:MAG: fatty-acid oxidation protein subunit alpha [Leptolyngbyaceae cyanobacterium SL_5_9]|nr:fatty-acid oxidation protein subunit alpha [Leptolyngbyaceae cyanobacterium SL_5_9]NJO76899.1 fatty-acid oxidation protein subunit alpha [Leptolyngbyaceae cyanobacterium RM1_406_9]
MSAKDRFHDVVKTALQKDGWIITDEPLQLPIERLTSLYIDFGAEKLIIAQRENQKIAVEVKSFLGASTLSEFHTAIGQCLNYRYALEELDPERKLYLAVPSAIYADFFSVPFIQSVIRKSQINLVVYDVAREELIKWQN